MRLKTYPVKDLEYFSVQFFATSERQLHFEIISWRVSGTVFEFEPGLHTFSATIGFFQILSKL